MKIEKKGKVFAFRLTEENFQKLVSKAIDTSQKRQKVTSIQDILNEFISKLK